MPQNINSAYRVREILLEAKKKQDKTPVHEVWAEIFDIEETEQNPKNFAISRRLADLHDEVELIRTEMMKLDFSESLYSPSLNKCNAVFGVQTIMATWQSPKQQISPEVETALGFCSEILPNEELLIDEKNIDELKQMASELRANLENSKLPIYTKNIIEKHLSKIEEALTKYRAVGAKALDEVMQSAYGEVIANETVFEEASGSQELGKLSAIWQKTKIILDGVVSTDKRIGAAQGMAEKGQKVIEFIQNINL